MATVIRGDADAIVLELKRALDGYEVAHPGTEATLFRENPASVRIRVIGRLFEGMAKSRRHDAVWTFLTQHVSDESLSEIAQLVALAPAELRTSFANFEFEDPAPLA